MSHSEEETEEGGDAAAGEQGDDNFVSEEEDEGRDAAAGEEGDQEADRDRDDAKILEEGLQYLNNKILATSRKAALSWVHNLSSVLRAFGKVASTALQIRKQGAIHVV